MRIWVFGAAAAVICGYFLNLWVTSHSLGVAVGEHYAIVAVGWAAFGLTVGAGVLAGAFLVMLAHICEGIAKLFDFFIAKERLALIEDRKKFESEKNSIFKNITCAADEAREDSVARAARANEARYAAQGMARAMEHRNEVLKGRLMGAQQRAARKAKRQEKVS